MPAFGPDHWRALSPYLDQALSISPDKRGAWLASIREQDPKLAADLQSLLEELHALDDQGFLQHGAATLPSPAPPAATGLGDSAQATPVDPFAGRVLLSRYRLEERLGAGGMGVVYRASDLTLGRAVAIKFLSQKLASDGVAKARFVREARAASALDHPNIAAVHDIGEADGELFIVMPLYDGRTLKQRIESGPVPVEEAVGLLRQVALGLDAAHRAGIVHRDVKPANAQVTSSGVLKLLDFGLAKLESDAMAQPMTEVGRPIGTVLYMSPEQLRGEAVDFRTDLWSFGVLAYELLAGSSPFKAESNSATAIRIINDEAPSLVAHPAVPGWLAGLVAQLLRKDPANRPQSASEVARRLEDPRGSQNRAALPEVQASLPSHRIRRAAIAALIMALLIATTAGVYRYRGARHPTEAVKSLVVLPFLNASGNADMEYLSDGIAETLIDKLAQVPELKVIARNTAFRYKGKDVDLQKLGRDLSVEAVLTGRVQQRGGALIVHAELVKLGDGLQLWGEKYHRQLTDILDVEEEIAKGIIEKLQPRLAPAVNPRVARRSTTNPEAHQLYLRGRYLTKQRTKESLDRAIEYFQQAIGVDPNYALAYAGLADAYTFSQAYASTSPQERDAKSEVAVLKALALDDELAEAHASLGLLRVYQWDWVEAEKELKRAVALNPNHAAAHGWYGLYWRIMGRPEKAAAEITRAQQLDPASPGHVGSLGLVLCDMGQYERGIAYIKESLQLESGNPGWFSMAVDCYFARKMDQEAIAELKRGLALDPSNPFLQGALARAYALSGQKDRALAILKQLQERAQTSVTLGEIALVYVALDDKERAFEWLEKAYQQRSHVLPGLKVAPLNGLRADPRYQDLLRRVGLPP